MKRRVIPALFMLAVALLPSGCKIRPTPVAGDAEAQGGAFNPDKMVADIWDAKVLPYLTGKAGDFIAVRALEASDLAAAGAKYGHKEKVGSSPWTLVVKLEGKVTAANTASRAATVDIDADGDGKADATVQIGPAMRGTAVRDSLDFVSFSQFTNQIDFAQFGKAFNAHANKAVLQKLPRDKLVGATVSIVGAYQHGVSSGLPLVTPARFEMLGQP